MKNSSIKKLIALHMTVTILSLGVAALSCMAAGQAAPGPHKEELQKVGGNYYVVKDIARNEIRLHIDKATKLRGVIKTATRLSRSPQQSTTHCP